MRELIYVLSNGTIVKTLRDAQESGLSYTTDLVRVEEKKPELSPIRKAMLEQFGYVAPWLKDKVVLN